MNGNDKTRSKRGPRLKGLRQLYSDLMIRKSKALIPPMYSQANTTHDSSAEGTSFPTRSSNTTTDKTFPLGDTMVLGETIYLVGMPDS